MTRTVAYNMIQLLFVIGFAPLYSGVLSRFKENIQSKRGPSIFQPYRDLWKLFHKDEVVSSETTWIFRFTPYLVFIIPLFVASLIPVLTDYPLAFAFMGDMLAGGFFLALGRVLRRTRGGRYRKPLWADGSKPNAHGWVSSGAGFHDRVLHRIVRGAIDHPVHRSEEVGRQLGGVLFSGAYLAC